MWIVTGLSAAVYLAAAVLLDFVYRSFADDAVSRLANGFYVLYSRDPHLAAIGFVWTPLTSMADFVPLLLKPLWPVLATHAFAGSVVTVAAMAAAVHQLRSALLEWGVARTPRVVLTLLFALNPMIVFFAANGMSEALLVFTLLATTRYLLRWMRDEDDVRSLVYAGVALAFAYLARNETLAAVALSGALVFTVSALRVKRWRPADEGGGKRTSRYMGAMTDTLVYVAPFLAAFLGWLGAAYLIVKDPFQQFHANAALVQESGFRPGPMSERLSHELNAVIHLMPLLPLIALGALVVAWRRRDAQVAVPIAVIGGPLAFDLIGYASGQLFPWLRYYILAIPIGVLLLGYLLSPVSVVVDADAKRQAPAARRRLGESRRLVATAGGVAVVVLALGPSLPASALGMVDPTVGVGETIQNLGFIFHAHPDAQDRQEQHRYDHVLAIGAALTAMHLPHGSVLVDNDVACIPDVLTTIADDKVFVIPNDRDFQKILADPLVFHAHYLLAPVHSSYPDLVNNAYPDLSLAGNGVTTIVRTFPAENGCDELRLYRVVGHPSGA
ncbi:MAG TPA: hypothetical protein VMU09_01375 [Acidimicrobiales bacterium]|nr:hypothetical protein [Acidimicrobiales bacterium]